jgi:dynein heavy chain
VQPYLKKCFEGINLLQFTKEQVITGIISAEQEIMSLSGQIIPADAKVYIYIHKHVEAFGNNFLHI